MNRHLSIPILILSFGFSSSNVGLAAQIINAPPIVVQPYELQDLNQEMLNRDRQNRDQEITIRSLIEENNKLIEETQASQKDAEMQKINLTMLNYRNSLLSRDEARIMANSQSWSGSRYGDLVALTEDADAMTANRGAIAAKSDLLAQKYQMLEALKDEMVALNDKLRNQSAEALGKKQVIIESYQKVAQQQDDKIQELINKLAETDKRLSHFDDIIAEKDRKIENLQVQAGTLESQIQQQISDLNGKDQMLKEQQNQIASMQNSGPLKDQVNLLKSELENRIVQENGKDQTIQEQQSRIASLQAAPVAVPSTENVALSPVVINSENKGGQTDYVDLPPIIVNSYETYTINKQAPVVVQSVPNQEPQVVVESPNPDYTALQAKIMSLRKSLHAQILNLKIKQNSIRWLNKVLAATKNKAEYYKLTAQQAKLTVAQAQQEVQQLKDDFTRQIKNDDQLEGTIASLKMQVSQLNSELDKSNTQNQQDVQIQQDLKTQLSAKEDQIAKMKEVVRLLQQKGANKGLAKQLIGLQYKESDLLVEIDRLRIMQNIDFEQHAQDIEEKIKELVDQHQMQNAQMRNRMQELKDELDQRRQEAQDIRAEMENKMSLLTDKVADAEKNQNVLGDQIGVLKYQMQDKDNQIMTMKGRLESSQADNEQAEKNQGVLTAQVDGLKSQLQDKEDQIIAMKDKIKSGEVTYEEAEALKQQLADQQSKLELLEQEFNTKIFQSNKMSSMLNSYQRKLEAKNSDYNAQLKAMLLSKNYQSQMEGQISDLNSQLQEKEAQIVRVKKEMYDLQQAADAKSLDIQTKDLSLSMMQKKVMDAKLDEYEGKINALQAANDSQVQIVKTLKTELALARQQLSGMPSSDEVNYLRSGFNQATKQLQEKNATLSQIKINVDEYQKEFKDQSSEFQSLKQQLQSAYEEINHKNEDLKYKDLAIVRLKERAAINGGGYWHDEARVLIQRLDAAEAQLKRRGHGGSPAVVYVKGTDTYWHDQAMDLTRKLKVTEAELNNKEPGSVRDLRAKLLDADAQIQDLQHRLDLMKPAPEDRLRKKLKEALVEIDEQGRVINLLVRKLHDAGVGVNLKEEFAKTAVQ